MLRRGDALIRSVGQCLNEILAGPQTKGTVQRTDGSGPRSRSYLYRRFASLVLLITQLLIAYRPAEAYSVLTHQQLIDQSWQSTIVPILLSRYPQLTPDQLKRAHAYAYGGSVIQDLG